MNLKDLLNTRKRVLAASLAGVLVASAVLPQAAHAFDLNNYYSHFMIGPTWESEAEADAALLNFEKTGLAFNQNYFPGVQDNMSLISWPLGAVMYLEPRSGYDNTGFEHFEYRHTFCSGSHEVALTILPGTRAFQSGKYTTEAPLPSAAHHPNR